MKQTISAPNTVPTANIAVNKSRLKVYNNAGSLPTYYLQKGQEFSIELANPTKDVVLAKIILNGKAISQGGLVLKPGQRIWLERYLDVAKKFLFDTYEVSGSKEMKEAIANNGDIKVEFYRERNQGYGSYHQLNGNSTITLANYNPRTTTTATGTGGSGWSTLQGSLFDGSVSTFCSSSTPINGGTYTSSLGTMSFGEVTNDSLSMPAPEPKLTKGIRAKSLSKSVETGRVEEGSKSDQEFKTVNKTFEYYAFHTVEYKMLPVSQKINTAEDVNVKVYCTNCGSKLGKTDKFCASCGTKR